MADYLKNLGAGGPDDSGSSSNGFMDFVNGIIDKAKNYRNSFDTGGISSGPVSGYSATLHGTEAVVPLPDNKSIPVSLDSSSITAAINQQTAVTNEVLRVLQKNNNLTSQIAQNSY